MEKYVHRRSDRHLPPVSLIVFAALLCGFALVNLFWPKRENSELENRKLAQMPVFSVKTLLNGKWQDDFSTYLQDQVALRDGWINLESAQCPRVWQNGGKRHPKRQSWLDVHQAVYRQYGY